MYKNIRLGLTALGGCGFVLGIHPIMLQVLSGFQPPTTSVGMCCCYRLHGVDKTKRLLCTQPWDSVRCIVMRYPTHTDVRMLSKLNYMVGSGSSPQASFVIGLRATGYLVRHDSSLSSHGSLLVLQCPSRTKAWLRCIVDYGLWASPLALELDC